MMASTPQDSFWGGEGGKAVRKARWGRPFAPRCRGIGGREASPPRGRRAGRKKGGPPRYDRGGGGGAEGPVTDFLSCGHAM